MPVLVLKPASEKPARRTPTNPDRRSGTGQLGIQLPWRTTAALIGGAPGLRFDAGPVLIDFCRLPGVCSGGARWCVVLRQAALRYSCTGARQSERSQYTVSEVPGVRIREMERWRRAGHRPPGVMGAPSQRALAVDSHAPERWVTGWRYPIAGVPPGETWSRFGVVAEVCK